MTSSNPLPQSFTKTRAPGAKASSVIAPATSAAAAATAANDFGWAHMASAKHNTDTAQAWHWADARSAPRTPPASAIRDACRASTAKRPRHVAQAPSTSLSPAWASNALTTTLAASTSKAAST